MTWIWVTVIDIFYALTSSEAINTTASVVVDTIFTSAVQARIARALVNVMVAVSTTETRTTIASVFIYSVLDKKQKRKYFKRANTTNAGWVLREKFHDFPTLLMSTE